MRDRMSPQVTVATEVFVAEGARVVLVMGVGEQVCLEVALLTETLLTPGALVAVRTLKQ